MPLELRPVVRRIRQEARRGDDFCGPRLALCNCGRVGLLAQPLAAQEDGLEEGTPPVLYAPVA